MLLHILKHTNSSNEVEFNYIDIPKNTYYYKKVLKLGSVYFDISVHYEVKKHCHSVKSSFVISL